MTTESQVMKVDCRHVAVCILLWFGGCSVVMATPVTLSQSFAGNFDFVVTGGTLRTQANPNSCTVTNSGTGALSGIPASATIHRAFLYWAGSGSTSDLNVTFNGSNFTASRSFTESVGGGSPRDWFGGFVDITSSNIVQTTRNGTYTFSNLTVDNGGNHCTIATVLSGWGLVVIYEDNAEPLRVINLFDGLQNFRGSALTLTPNNFQIPSSPIDGQLAVLTWEGDLENSAPLGGFNENLVFNGATLSDALNPVNNQYNSVTNAIPSTTTFGVDFDVYDISSLLTAGDTSASTTYSSGGDRVLLGLELISVTNVPVADLAIAKSHTGDFSAGQQESYALSVSNNGPNDDNNTITVSDTLPAGLSFVSATSTDANWSCGNAGQVVTCTHPGPLAASASLADISLTVDVASSAAPSVSNTASVSSATFDNISANDSATDVANVFIPDVTTSSKAVADLNGGDADPGDTLRYTITITETAGADIDNVSVTDTLDPLLSGLSVVSIPAGATDNSGANLDVSNISVAANSSVTIVFDATIVGSAVPGDTVDNTAVINNPVTAVNTNALAPTVIVSASSIPGSGTKELYFNTVLGSQNAPTLPQTMSRTPLTAVSSPTRVRLRRQDTPRRWDITPALQADLGLDAAAIPVVLQMRRNNATQTRDIRVTVDFSGTSAGFWGCQDLAIGTGNPNGLSNSVTRTFTFNVQQTDANCNAIAAAPTTLAAGTVVRVSVDNQVGGTGNGRAIFIYPFNDSTPDTSRVELPATTVINVDSVAGYDAAFPGGSIAASYPPGSDVFLRAVVSDPFGSFDITAANIEIIDANTTTVVTSTAMTEVNDSLTNTKTYEFQYTIPGAGPVGTWTARVIADEGTEGTIDDLGVGTFEVAQNQPQISIMKLVSTVSDAVNVTNPKAIPGAVIEYLITVNNMGPGQADNDSIVITDPIASSLQLFLGNPADPVQFANGSPVSGLSYTFTSLADTADDVAFSNDGGSSFITPIVDGNGYDITVPPINLIRINPKGILNASSGSGDPGFTLRFRGRVR